MKKERDWINNDRGINEGGTLVGPIKEGSFTCRRASGDT